MAGLRLYFSTIKYMKMRQITARLSRYLKRRMKTEVLPPKIVRQLKYPPKLYVDILDDNPTVAERFLVSRIPENEVHLLNMTRKVDYKDMTPEGETTPLWRFNLLYLEYLIPLANRYVMEDRIDCIRSIRDIMSGAREAFEKGKEGRSPYVLALQTTNLLIVNDILSRVTSFFSKRESDDFLVDLYRKYCYLQNHREKELLANHYFENIKALLILSIAFGEEKKVEEYMKELQEELKEQILPDGMHYERSFMYHKLILEDLLRIILASRETPWEEKIYNIVGPYIIGMSNILGHMETNVPRTLFFNDAADNVAKPAKDLLRTAELLGFVDTDDFEPNVKSQVAERFKAEASGFYRVRKDNITLVFDTGKISPDYNPGHAHNSFMSFEIFGKNMPVIVNSGVGCYQGPDRKYNRSTAAHNTFMIDNVDQSECWAEHRVGRRISDISVSYEEDKLVGEFTDQKGRRGRRTVLFRKDLIKVFDEVVDGDKAKITSFLHFDPDFFLTRKSGNVYTVSHSVLRMDFEILLSEGTGKIISRDESHPYATGFGKKEKIDILVMEGSRVSYVIRPSGYEEKKRAIMR